MKKLTHTLWIGLAFLMVMSCSDDELDPARPLEFTQEDLSLIHGDGEKQWRVTRFYNNFERGGLNSEVECHADDIYRFRADFSRVEVTPGEISCFFPDPDQEFINVLYEYDNRTGQVFLTHERGAARGIERATEFLTLELQEVTATSLFFAEESDNGLVHALLFEEYIEESEDD